MPASQGENGPVAVGILADLWSLVHSVLDDAEPELATLGLTPKAYFLLDSVGDHPFPALLARRMHLPPPTVTYLVKQLEAKGLLERRAEPDDLRKFRLVPTAAGRDALSRGGMALSRKLGERLARLDRDEVAALGRSVSRLAGPSDEGQ